MKTHILPLVCLGATAILSAGCPEYYSIDEACHPKGTFVGENALGPVEVEAFNRMNCYRRLSGVLRGTVNTEVQGSAAGQVSYILANPDMDRVLGSRGPEQYLSQIFDDPGFTGANIFERLDNAGYVFVDPRGTTVEEFILFKWDPAGTDLPTGSAAMDYLFRNHVWRQYGLQPSWIDGAYTEAELSRDWFITAEYCKFYECEGGEPPANLSGRVYHAIIIHDSPHLEHADRPIVYPKNSQVQVPLWSESKNLASIDVLGFANPVQISYPITLFAGVIDESNAKQGDQNIYGLDVIASVVEAGGDPIETQIVLPGSSAEKVYPDGFGLRQVASIFTREPLNPSSTYQLFADVTTNEATFAVDIEFTTAAEDPGLIANTTNYTSAATTRQAPERVQEYLLDHPNMVRFSQPALP